MNNVVEKQLLALEYGEPQTFGSVTLVPLFLPNGGGPQYLTMQQAIAMGALIVTEVSAGGSVPELKVENKADMPVLMLDGEELAGAKQNRVLNTTVLLKEKQVTSVPVSCTEQGRWSYVSERFSDSGVFMESRIRGTHKASVNASLRRSGRFDSDQGAVWSGVSSLLQESGVSAPTSAMKDVYEHRKGDIESYVDALPVREGQQGMVVFVGGEIVGSDFVSQPTAYGILHPKLVKSYAMEAVVSKKRKAPSGRDYRAEARAFIESARSAEEHEHPSIGYGTDYRYESALLVGSALIHEGYLIHSAFFSLGDEIVYSPMAGARQRRLNRI